MNYKEICASVTIYTSVHPSKPRPVSVNKQFLRDLIASTKLNEWVYYMKDDNYKLLTQGNTEVWVSRNEIYVQTYEGANIWRVADDSSNTVNSAMPELAKAPLNLYVKLQQTLHRQVRSIHPTTGPFPPDMLKKLEKRDVETARIGYEAEIIVGDAWQAKREVLSKRENAIGLVRSNAGSDDLAALFGSQALAERVASMLNDEDVTEDEVREQALELACKNCATFNLIADPQWYMNKARSILEGTQTVDDVVPTKPVCTPTGTGGMCEQTVTASCDPAIEEGEVPRGMKVKSILRVIGFAPIATFLLFSAFAAGACIFSAYNGDVESSLILGMLMLWFGLLTYLGVKIYV